MMTVDAVLYASVLSKEFIRVRIRGTEADVPVDPTGTAPQFQFTAIDVDPTSWITGSWETEPPPSGGTESTYKAKVMIGPGSSLALSVGKYEGWVKWTPPVGGELPATRFCWLVIS